ncbi:SsrA-binding protein, partial [Clostridium perfringens]
IGIVQQQGVALIPLSLYLKNGRVKVNLGVCRGKKNYDKRDTMLEKAHKREMDRQLKERNRY